MINSNVDVTDEKVDISDVKFEAIERRTGGKLGAIEERTVEKNSRK